MNEFISLISLLRPLQWLKNFMLLFPPFLGGVIFAPGILKKGILPFIAFCLAASGMYALNDVLDAKRDSTHPTKRYRVVTSGRVSSRKALLFSAILVAGAITFGMAVSRYYCYLVCVYIVITSLYTLYLKKIPLLDIFCIASGFLIRLQAGGVVFDMVISEWLYLNVLFLSIFLSAGKRLAEKNMLGDDAGSHRKSLEHYPEGFLDIILVISGTAALITYTLYTINRFPLVLTVPLCIFGLLRYLYRVKSGQSGDPTDSLVKDIPLLVISLLWGTAVGWSIYH